MIQSGAKMGGHLAGIGIRHADGSEDFRFLDDGPHNTIVDCGIDHLFMMNGTPNGAIGGAFNSRFIVPQWVTRTRVGASTSYACASGQYYTGVLGLFRIGTDGAVTNKDDTGLHAPVTSFSGYRKTSSTIPYCGSCKLAYGKEAFRVTSVSHTVSEDCTIRELGWYGSYGETEQYRMFARIVLTSPVELHAGESLIATYQLEIQHANATETDISNIGILDADGNDMEYGATVRYYNWYNFNTSTPFNCTMGAPYIRWDGNDSVESARNGWGETDFDYLPTFVYAYNVYPVKLSTSATYSSSDDKVVSLQYSTSSSKGFPSTTATGYDTSNLVEVCGSSQAFSCARTVDNYVPGSGYRDYHLKLFGGNSNVNMYYLRTHGMDYKFFKMVDGVKTYTPLVVPAGGALTLNFRVSYST